MERPPPKIEVPTGQPQPIATKYGLTYEIPADWRNFSTGYATWIVGDRHVAYGAIGDYGYKHCAESDGSTLAQSGIAGRDGMDLHSAALDAAKGAEVIFGVAGGDPPKLTYAGPTELELAGGPAVRYTVHADAIRTSTACDPREATFDVVALPARATATTAVFMVELVRNIDGALDHSIADQIFSTIRATDDSEVTGDGK